MFPYWLLFTLFSAGAIEYRRSGASGSQAAPLLAAGGILIALMIGLRYEVGADWHNYELIYRETAYLGFAEAMSFGDPGYAFLNWLSHYWGLEIWFVNLVCSLIFGWGLVQFARRQPNPWLAMTVAVPYLVIVVAMGYTRQAVAIGCILAALSAFDQHRLVRFTLLIVLATTFHKTAVIVLPLVALALARSRVLIGTLLLVIAFTLYILFLQSAVDVLLTNYVEAEYSSQGAAVRVAMNIVPALIFLFFGAKLDFNDSQRKLWRNFSYAAVLSFIFLFILPSSTAIDRLALYIIPLQIAVLSRLPDAFSVQGRANGQLVMAILIYSALVQFIWLNYAQHAEYWVPYQLYPFSEE